MSDIPNHRPSARDARGLTSVFEVLGSALGMVYALVIAMNVGAELLGFSLLLTSSGLFAAWAVLDRRWSFLLLQGVYAVSAVVGLVRWG